MIIQSNYNQYYAELKNLKEDKNRIVPFFRVFLLLWLVLVCGFCGFLLVCFVAGFFFLYLPMLSHLGFCTLTIFADTELNFHCFPKSSCFPYRRHMLYFIK